MANNGVNIPKFRHQDHQGRFKHGECYFTPTSKEPPKPVDLIITYRSDGKKRSLDGVVTQLTNRIYRERFENALINQGLEVAHEDDYSTNGVFLSCLKIHATDYFLKLHADSQEMEVPVKLINWEKEKSTSHRLLDTLLKPDNPKNPYSRRNDTTNELGDPHSDYVSIPYSIKHSSLYISDKPSRLFTSIQRISLVWKCVTATRLKFVPKQQVEAKFMNKVYLPSKSDLIHQDIAFEWLLHNKVYSAAFPLHDSPHKLSAKTVNSLPCKQWPLRPWLYKFWVSQSMVKVQPLNAIRAYFGECTGIHFAWLGFYTAWLYVAALMGLVTFIYGFVRTYTDDLADYRSSCLPQPGYPEYLCRTCLSTKCIYVLLNSTCADRKIESTFDHHMTIFFSLFICVWAKLLLEFWTRRQNELSVIWNVAGDQASDELGSPRVKFMESKYAEKRVDSANKKETYFIARKILLFRRTLTALATVLFIGINFAVLIGIAAYRTRMTIIFSRLKYNGSNVLRVIDVGPAISITTAIINAIFIYIMQAIWLKVVKYLVDFELRRTTKAHDTSFTLKVVIVAVLNYYGLLFYLALMKGKGGHKPNESSKIPSSCDPRGCLFEVSIQLIVLLVGKQIFNNFMELCIPWLRVQFSRLKQIIAYTFLTLKHKIKRSSIPRWKQDSVLMPVPRELHHFEDYLLLVMQFGFITIFSTAFPLAALISLLNNLLLIRVSARNLLVLHRRPIPTSQCSIGVWMNVLAFLAEISVVINAFIIAFTTTFIDRLVYGYRYMPKGVPYQALIYNSFNTSEYTEEMEHLRYNTFDVGFDVNRTVLIGNCLYNGRFITDKMDLLNIRVNRYYIVTIRLLFVIVFYAIVVVIKGLIGFVVPQESQRLRERKFKSKRFMERWFKMATKPKASQSTSGNIHSVDKPKTMAKKKLT